MLLITQKMNKAKKINLKKEIPRKATKTDKLIKAVLLVMVAALGVYTWNKIVARFSDSTIVTKMNNVAEDTWTNVKVNPKYLSDKTIENLLMSGIS
ncbi:unnamed protein product [Nezara viridula]|uniref:Uncharacterized protein n=1 Tax=Nezara viridula TaxID=85310 RepID=A0A9P0E5N3_NEZVI|nr:unnamed protein product [Nezara viridula]